MMMASLESLFHMRKKAVLIQFLIEWKRVEIIACRMISWSDWLGTKLKKQRKPKKMICRFCIGKPEGHRSTVWKVWANKQDVYLQSRMMGSEAKISIHALGQAQFSLTDVWVKRTGAKNSERHIYKWQIPQLSNNEKALIFRIIFPESELQQVGKPRKDLQIHWENPPQKEFSKVIECYISKSHGNILKAMISTCEHLETFQLDKARYFVMLIREKPIKAETEKILLDCKKSNITYVGSTSVELLPKNRAVIFIKKPVPEIVELNKSLAIS